MSTIPELSESRAKQQFLRDVVEGLAGKPKRLPCKYLYDRRGSRLFDRICETAEYYITRTELQIMRRFSGEMGQQIGPQAMLVEYGSGSSHKTRVLLEHLIDPVAYSPVDISRSHLLQTADDLQNDYPSLEVLPVPADFTEPFELPTPSRTPRSVVIYFPGSTIGNFQQDAAVTLLREMRRHCGHSGGLIIGIDLQKDVETLEAAYNDAEGVTDAFNLNLLRRINRELNGDFDESKFHHEAKYDATHHRIDIRLVSNSVQTVHVGGHRFDFDAGETIRTEYSHKYSVGGFANLASQAGFHLKQDWTDDRRLFGVLYLTVS